MPSCFCSMRIISPTWLRFTQIACANGKSGSRTSRALWGRRGEENRWSSSQIGEENRTRDRGKSARYAVRILSEWRCAECVAKSNAGSVQKRGREHEAETEGQAGCRQ